MKLNYIILSILLITGSFQEVTEDYIKDKYKDFCEGREYSDVADFQDKLSDYRDERSNEYFNDIGLVLEDFGSGERRKIIDLTIAPYILLIFHLFFVFVMLIVFLLAYCNVVKCRHVKAMIAVSALFFLIVFVCFWVGLGFMVTANKTRREAYCYLFKLQNNLLYGNPNDGAEAFIGVHNMVALVTEFESEVPEIQRTSQNYISLQNANFKQKTQQAFSQVVTFVNNNQAQTHNASGQLKKPISNINLNPGINYQVETEFTEIYRLGSKLTEFASIVSNFEQDSYVQQMTSMLSALKTQYARFALALLDLEHSVGHYDKFEKHLKYGSRITLYSSIAFVVFALVALFMACGKESARKTGYCVLALASLVLLLIAAGFMFWIFGVAESSAFCGALRDVNKGELEVMTSRNVSEDFLNFVKSCILEDPSVDYRQTVFTTSSSQTYYNDFLRYVEALTEYRNFIDKNQVNSAEIPRAKDQWQRVVDGHAYDHLDASKKLEEFNDAISCDGDTYFAFALPACDSNSDCKSIADTTAYSAPSCADNATQVNQDFLNLKQYTTDSISNAKKLIAEAGETTDVNTPNGAYTEAAKYLKSFQPQVQQASTIHDDSLKLVQAGRTYNDVSDCSMFKKDSLRLEYYGCYNFTYWNYKAIINWAVFVVAAFLYLLFMFWALGKDQEEKEEKEVEYTPEPQKFYTNQADDLNVDDNEKIPMA